MTTRDFHIGDILSITTSLFVSSTGSTRSIRKVLEFLSGVSPLGVNQLSRCADEVRADLIAQLPKNIASITEGDLKKIISDCRGCPEETLVHLEDTYGMQIALRPVDSYQAQDAKQELIGQFGEAFAKRCDFTVPDGF